MSIVVPGFIPSATEEMTQAKIHRIIDEAVITTVSEDAMSASLINDSLFPVANTQFTMAPVSLQLAPSDAAFYIHSGASVGSLFKRWGLSKVEIGITPALAYEMPPAGWPCYIPSTMAGEAAYAGWSAYSLGCYDFVPPLSGICKLRWTWHPTAADACHVNVPYPVVILNTGGGTAQQFREFVMYGFAQALVHATLSNSLNSGDCYALRNDVIGAAAILPVCWNHTDSTSVTQWNMTYGLVRKVYASSGITMVTLPGISPAVVAPFYVAEIFFGGAPCL